MEDKTKKTKPKTKSVDATTKKYAAKPSDLGTGMARKAADAILKRKKMLAEY